MIGGHCGQGAWLCEHQGAAPDLLTCCTSMPVNERRRPALQVALVDHELRFSPMLLQAQRHLQSGALGRVLYVQVVW